MSANRSLWCFLLTVFQIVTLVAFSVAGAGHSHAGATHVGHVMVASAGHSEAPGPEQVVDLADPADPIGDEATAEPCGLCCCHASFVRWDLPVMTVAWKPGTALAGIREVAFDSVASETLPEPPRTIA